MNLHRIVAVASKEWRETTRDRMFLSLAFLVPVIWMVVFGYGLVLDVENIPFAVVDRDRSALSRDYSSRFIESRYFDFKGYAGSLREAEELLARAEIRAVIVIPEQFQERLRSGRSVEIQTLIDGTFPLRGDITKGYVLAINNAFSQELLVDHVARTRGLTRARAWDLLQPVQLEVRYLYNQAVKSIWSMAPGLVMFSLMIASPLLTALGVVREKERGSIYNIYSSTVTRLEFLIGKLSPYVLISAVNVLVLWALATGLFGVPFKGNFLFFLAASLVFVLCTTAMGLIISLLVRTQMAALVITILVSIVPTFLYSGLLVPVSSLSPGAQVQAHLFPGMYYMDVVRGSFLKGVGPGVLGWEVLALAGYTLMLLMIGYALFRKRPKA